MNEKQVEQLWKLAYEQYDEWGNLLVECETKQEVIDSGKTASQIIKELKAHAAYVQEIRGWAF
jgi:hypothetical protein